VETLTAPTQSDEEQERSGVLSEEAQGRLDMMEAQLAEQQEAFAQEESRQEAARAQFLQEATQLEDNEGEGRNIIKFNEMHKHLKTWYSCADAPLKIRSGSLEAAKDWGGLVHQFQVAELQLRTQMVEQETIAAEDILGVLKERVQVTELQEAELEGRTDILQEQGSFADSVMKDNASLQTLVTQQVEFFQAEDKDRDIVLNAEVDARLGVREAEYNSRITHQREDLRKRQLKQRAAAIKIQTTWRGYEARKTTKLLARQKLRGQKQREALDRIRAQVDLLNTEELNGRMAIEASEAEQLQDWYQVHSEQWGQIVAEYDERQNRLAVEERTRICSQLNQFEQDRLLTQQENERAGYITEEEMLRMQLLQGRETDFIITQMNIHERTDLKNAEIELRRELLIEEVENFWGILIAEWGTPAVPDYDSGRWTLEREKRHRVDLRREEREEREYIYKLRWAELTYLLRIPNEKATIIQTAWRGHVARRDVEQKKRQAHYANQILQNNKEVQELEARARAEIEDTREMELAAAQDAEEEDWTRTHVRAIERCYMAYKTRQTINELVRKNQRTLMPTGQDLFYNPPGAYMDQSQAAYNQQSQAQYPQQMMAQQAYFMPGYQMPVSQMGGYGAMMVPMQAQDPNQQMQMQQMQMQQMQQMEQMQQMQQMEQMDQMQQYGTGAGPSGSGFSGY
jgi:hypothetical protein